MGSNPTGDVAHLPSVEGALDNVRGTLFGMILSISTHLMREDERADWEIGEDNTCWFAMSDKQLNEQKRSVFSQNLVLCSEPIIRTWCLIA